MPDQKMTTPQDDMSPDSLVGELVQSLRVNAIEPDLYLGPADHNVTGRVFGGHVIAQALLAASHSVEPQRLAHSLHAYFMRSGDTKLPIKYRVERDFDGRSFATRRVVALQEDCPILNMAASFHVPEDGLSHQEAMPDVPEPEGLPTEQDLINQMPDELPENMKRFFARPRPFEFRPVDATPPFMPVKREPRQCRWFRLVASVGDDPALHRSILGYVSDMMLLSTSALPHGISWLTHNLQSASIDHALWMHDSVRTDEWLLYTTDSPWSGHARGFNRGQIFARDGRLVASVAQEGLMRLRGEQKT